MFGPPRQPEIAGGAYPALGGGRHGIDRLALPPPGLDLDEDGKIALARDDVDLAKPGAMANGENAIALGEQVKCGEILGKMPSTPCLAPFREIAATVHRAP